jgi:GntR family transcriptional regulator
VGALKIIKPSTMPSKRSNGEAPPRQSKPAKYQIIADWLRARVLAGEYAEGARLPSEHALMKRFDVSRVTVRQALSELRQLGLVESRQGKGYFARRIQPVQDLQRLQGFKEMLAPFGVETRSNVIEILEVPADVDAADALGVARGDPIIRVARTRLAGSTALSLNISMFPLELGRRLVSLDVSRNDIFALLEQRLDIELGFADLVFDVVPADARYARYFGAEPGEPSIQIRRLTYDASGAPIDFELIYCRADAMRFRARLSRW